MSTPRRIMKRATSSLTNFTNRLGPSNPRDRSGQSSEVPAFSATNSPGRREIRGEDDAGVHDAVVDADVTGRNWPESNEAASNLRNETRSPEDNFSTRLQRSIVSGLPSFSSFNTHFEYFMRNMHHELPIVSYHLTDVTHTYASNKVLSMAIIAIICGVTCPDQQWVHFSKIVQAQSDCMSPGDFSSLELIDTYLLMAAWSWPKAKAGLSNHEYLDIAATLATGLGIDRPVGGIGCVSPAGKIKSTEERRAFLSCYVLCSE